MATKLRTRFSIIIILLAIVPQILAAIILANLATEGLEEQSLILQQEIAANVGHQIEAFILGAERELILLDEVFGLGALDKESQRKVLNNLLLNNRIYQELILLDKTGREQIHLSRSGVVLESALQLHDNEEEYLFPVREKSTFFGPVQFNVTTNEPLTKIAVPILEPRTGEVDFVLVASVRFKPIWDMLANLELPNQLDVYVVDENGQVVAHPNPTIVLRGTQNDIDATDGRAPGLSGRDSFSGSYILQLGQQELSVIAQQPVSSALMLANQYLQVTTGIMLISLLAAVGLVVLAIRQIIIPIETLASTAQAISAGDLTRQASVVNHDEIGNLALAFNSMTGQLSTMINTLEQSVEERTQDLQKSLIDQKKSEERYRRLIETSPDAITLTDLEGTILFCNPHAARLQGFGNAEEMIGKNAFEFVAPENAQLAIENARETLEMGSVRNVEYISVKADGTRFPVELSASVILDAEGKPNAMIGVVRDITKRKRAEEEGETLIKELEAKNIEAETLRESAAAVALALDPGEASSRILDQLQRVVPYDSASVQLLTGDELEIVGGRGFPKGKDAIGMKFTLGEDDAAYPIVEDGLPYIFYPNVQEVSDKFKDSDHNHILSWMAIPLYARGRLIGMFALDGFSVNKFTQAHAEFALTFANQVAVTLENSRLFSGLQSELKKQIALRGAIMAITSSLNVSEVLSEICRQMASTIDATSAFIANYDSTRSAHTIVAKYIEPTASELKQDSDLQATYYKKDGAWFFDDEAEDRFAVIHPADEDITLSMKEYLVLYGARSVLYIPLRIQGRLIGHTELWDSRRKREFTKEEISFCQALSQQAAVAIENASLFEQLAEEKERAEITLHSIGDAVITTDVNAQVDYLNPVAENLTGWKKEEAIGQPLEVVFRIIEEGSRQAALNPVERCIQEGKVVGLSNHSILISRDGREIDIDDSAAPIRNRKGEIIGVVLVFHDVTEARRLTQKLEHDAMYDSLTGLVNRREFERRLERALISAKEHGLSHILCYLDLDQFKIVNDTAGHTAGDELLKQVSGMMSSLFRQRDTFARLGGDEFGLLLENCQLDQALVIANEVLTKVRDLPFVWERRSFQIGVSIGVVSISEETESVEQLLSQADIACYSAKDLGRDRIHVYQIEDSETTRWHNDILQAYHTRDALINEQFRLFCQPIARLTIEESEIIQYEILLRMQDGEEHLRPPSAFIPSAERYGLMPAIDRWVIRETLLTMAKYDIQGIQITINLSGNSLDDERLLEYVLEQLHEFSISPEQICFEITETAAIHHLSKAQQFIRAFSDLGGKIALDDFGSGFSSFRYLKALSVDYIKIDGGFVNDMLSNPDDLMVVEAITLIAHTLGMEVIAEHASDLEIIARLTEIGVDSAQGFGIGYPVPVETVWGNKN